MNTSVFSSSLAAVMTAFVEWKCCSGISRKRFVRLLWYFDRFLCKKRFRGARLTQQVTGQYLQSMSHLGTGTRYNRFCVFRQFCRYLADTDPESFVPAAISSGNDAEVRRAYIYSDGQIEALLAAALDLSPQRPLRAQTYYTLLGLLSVTGLRISEAIALNLEDVQDNMLYVREGKFSKSRWLPLSESTRQALDRYMHNRNAQGSSEPNAPLFINLWGKRVNYTTVYQTFRRLLIAAGLHSGTGPGPRIHDLRHRFAVTRLLKWYQDGADVNARLPWLATYMGHCKIAHTAVYLHATAQLLGEVGKRFAKHFELNIQPFVEKASKGAQA